MKKTAYFCPLLHPLYSNVGLFLGSYLVEYTIVVTDVLVVAEVDELKVSVWREYHHFRLRRLHGGCDVLGVGVNGL